MFTVDGVWTLWTEFGMCSVTCGDGGITTRTRSCTNPSPLNGGKDCPDNATEPKSCSAAACPGKTKL